MEPYKPKRPPSGSRDLINRHIGVLLVAALGLLSSCTDSVSGGAPKDDVENSRDVFRSDSRDGDDGDDGESQLDAQGAIPVDVEDAEVSHVDSTSCVGGTVPPIEDVPLDVRGADEGITASLTSSASPLLSEPLSPGASSFGRPSLYLLRADESSTTIIAQRPGKGHDLLRLDTGSDSFQLVRTVELSRDLKIFPMAVGFVGIETGEGVATLYRYDDEADLVAQCELGAERISPGLDVLTVGGRTFLFGYVRRLVDSRPAGGNDVHSAFAVFDLDHCVQGSEYLEPVALVADEVNYERLRQLTVMAYVDVFTGHVRVVYSGDDNCLLPPRDFCPVPGARQIGVNIATFDPVTNNWSVLQRLRPNGGSLMGLSLMETVRGGLAAVHGNIPGGSYMFLDTGALEALTLDEQTLVPEMPHRFAWNPWTLVSDGGNLVTLWVEGASRSDVGEYGDLFGEHRDLRIVAHSLDDELSVETLARSDTGCSPAEVPECLHATGLFLLPPVRSDGTGVAMVLAESFPQDHSNDWNDYGVQEYSFQIRDGEEALQELRLVRSEGAPIAAILGDSGRFQMNGRGTYHSTGPNLPSHMIMTLARDTLCIHDDFSASDCTGSIARPAHVHGGWPQISSSGESVKIEAAGSLTLSESMTWRYEFSEIQFYDEDGLDILSSATKCGAGIVVPAGAVEFSVVAASFEYTNGTESRSLTNVAIPTLFELPRAFTD